MANCIILHHSFRRKTRGDDDSSYDDDDSYDDSYDDSDDYTDTYSEESDSYDSEDDDSEDEDNAYMPFKLPQIGYPKTPSLPPSSQSFRSRYSDYSDSVPASLPEVPSSRQLTALRTATSTRAGVSQVQKHELSYNITKFLFIA